MRNCKKGAMKLKNKTKKIGLAALSLSMAAVLSASVSLQTPVQNMQNGILGGNIANADTSNMVKLSDEFAAGLNTSQFMKDNGFENLQNLNSNSDGTRRIIVEFESKSQLDLYLENQNLQSTYAVKSA